MTIESGKTLTLDNDTVTGTTFTDTAAGAAIRVDGGTTLKLDTVTINGGIINDFSTGASGTVIAGDIDIIGDSKISGASLNKGGVTIESGKTLTLDNDTVTDTTFTDTAAGATIQVDGGTTLKLDTVTINGGIINDFSTNATGTVIAGDIDIIGDSTINGAGLNKGGVTIESGKTLTLDNDTVTGTTFTDTAAGATIRVDGGTTLKLDTVTINGGTINDFSTNASGTVIAGDIDIIGDSTISGASLNKGGVTIESGKTLTLDNDTVKGTTFTDTAAGATIQVDGGTTLNLDSVTINGGIINDFSTNASGTVIAGDIDIIGDSTINGASLNKGGVTIESGKALTLDNVTVNGTTFNDTASGATLALDGSDALNGVDRQRRRCDGGRVGAGHDQRQRHAVRHRCHQSRYDRGPQRHAQG